MKLTNLKRLFIKLGATAIRLLRMVLWLPIRLYRFFWHFAFGFSRVFSRKQPKTFHWWQDLAFLTLDLAGVPELSEAFFDFAKWNTRPLSPSEKKLAVTVFGTAIKLDSVRIDEKAKIGCRRHNIAYVSFFTVNSWGPLHPATLVHELVHVWQFQQLGSAYIPQALRAQRSKHGYNYGGLGALKECRQRLGKITDFNLEQQAEIVSDYYAVREGLKPVWGNATRADLPVYEYFVSQIRA